MTTYAQDQQEQTQTSANLQFTYDAAGNRIKRQYFAFRVMGDTSKSDPNAQQAAAQYGIHVYPNPLMDGSSVTVIVSNAKKALGEETTIYVLDNSGKTLFLQKQVTDSPSQIDLSVYAAGIYYLKVAVGKEVLFYKITKSK